MITAKELYEKGIPAKWRDPETNENYTLWHTSYRADEGLQEISVASVMMRSLLTGRSKTFTLKELISNLEPLATTQNNDFTPKNASPTVDEAGNKLVPSD